MTDTHTKVTLELLRAIDGLCVGLRAEQIAEVRKRALQDDEFNQALLKGCTVADNASTKRSTMADDYSPLAMSSALGPQSGNVISPPMQPGSGESPNVQHERQLLGKFESGIEKQRQDFEQGQAALDPIRDRVLKVLESPSAARAHLEKVKNAPKPEDYQRQTLAYATGMALLGAFAGKFTRAGGSASLDAFSSAIKGWQEGNLQAWHQGMEEWRANTEKTLANNQVELQKYREIIENKRLTVEQMMAALNIESARFQNKVMFDATENQNYEQAFRLTDTLERNAQKLQGSLDFFGRSMAEAKQSVSSQVDALTKYPQLMQNMKPDEYLRLKAAAEQFGLTMPAPPSQLGTRSNSVIGGDMNQFVADFTDKHQRPPNAQERLGFERDRNAALSYGRTEGTMSARVETATNELEQAIPLALQKSEAFDRTSIVQLNKLYNEWKRAGSDVGFTELELASFAAITAYTRAMNPQGVPRVNDRLEAHAINLLSSAQSKDAYRAQLRLMWQEAQRSKAAVAQTAAGPTPSDINAPLLGDRGVGGPQGGSGSDPLGIR